MNIYHRPPSEESLFALEALQSAVTQTLEKKKKLGHYAVVWKNGVVILNRFDNSLNETQIDDETTQLSTFQQFLVDSPEMTDTEYLIIEEKRKL